MTITPSAQTPWKQGNFPFKKPGSQNLVHSVKIPGTSSSICTMTQLYYFVILGLGDTFNEKAKMNT